MAPLPRRRFLQMTGLGAAGAALTGCGLRTPLIDIPQAEAPEPGTRVRLGAQSYYSNIVVAEILAQTLEAAGAEVERRFALGQREDYLPRFMAGQLDVFPEYGGHLLQYFRPDARRLDTAQIQLALQSALPTNMRALAPAEAADHERFVVTRALAEEHRLVDIADLRGLAGLRISAGAHVRHRPYGPKGLAATYDVHAEFIDTIPGDIIANRDALLTGAAEVAFIPASDPALARDDLVALGDPQMLVLSQLITPLVVPSLHPRFGEALATTVMRLDTETLQQLNRTSHYGTQEAGPIAKDWLSARGLA